MSETSSRIFSETLTALLSKAFDSEFGISISVSSIKEVRAGLYRAAKSNPNFANLRIIPSRRNPETHLWIVHKEPLNGQPSEDDFSAAL